MKTIKELIETLEQKDPNAEFEILIQNNPDVALTGQKHVAILVADGDTLRLN